MTELELLTILRNQHTAIDSLMALVLTREGEMERAGLIKREDMFMPSHSGHIWNAAVVGNAAIVELERKVG